MNIHEAREYLDAVEYRRELRTEGSSDLHRIAAAYEILYKYHEESSGLSVYATKNVLYIGKFSEEMLIEDIRKMNRLGFYLDTLFEQWCMSF